MNQCIADTAIFGILYALMGFAVWYPVYYNKADEADKISWIVTHFVSIAIITSIDISFGNVIVDLIDGTILPLLPDKMLYLRMAEGVVFYLVFLLYYFGIKVKDNNEERLRNEEKLLRLSRETELKALKWQINPHFLFNSLNSANFLTQTNPGKASEMLVVLSEYLRYSLKRNEVDTNTLSDELSNCRRYLDIEKFRFGDKLQAEFEFDADALNARVPVMILQPLYENAVKHGVYESFTPVKIKTVATLSNEMLNIVIENDFEPDGLPRKGTGTGLRNVDDQLQIRFGQKGLITTQKDKNRFIVTIKIPQKTEI